MRVSNSSREGLKEIESHLIIIISSLVLSICSLFLVDYIFIYQLRREEEMTMIPSPNEVKSVRYVTRSELASMFAQAGN